MFAVGGPVKVETAAADAVVDAAEAKPVGADAVGSEGGRTVAADAF